ncbi:MAG: hypothetical protein RMJ14_00335 [Nitrososphaerota archaeon]|nr:hypothetical protein [Aigarchaeota archaeon]MDW8076077.1 hypothetical protein [Nitrososphaerota archaeon]
MQVREVEEAFDKAKKVVKDKKEAYIRSIESKIEELLRKTHEVLGK